MRRIGIDVGGTNTDAVLIEDNAVVAAIKTPTSEDVTEGIVHALAELVVALGGAAGPLDAVMIGTTHFTNAVVQRRDLTPVAAIRIGLPASASLPPFVDWPEDLAEIARARVFMIAGGHEYDGRPIVPFDAAAMRQAAKTIAEAGIASVAVASVFSPLTAECELAAAEILAETCPQVDVTLSHELGRIGLLERENATLLNAAIRGLAAKTTRAFEAAIRASGIEAPLYLTQNDGTVMRADYAQAYPVYSFASGPTNSMRGAAYLSRLDDAMVVDVGGTTSDIGCLRRGFPREANNVVEIGGVRTLFRMPDLLSLALGGGTKVATEPLTIGPQSVGYRIGQEALSFGGGQLTASDVAAAAGLVTFAGAAGVPELDPSLVDAALPAMHEMLAEGVDRMKTDATPLPLIAVGGGAFLVPDAMDGIAEVVRVPHAEVANAVGAAIAQISGEIDQVFSGMGREAAIAEATRLAEGRAVEAGAEAATLDLVEVEDLPIAYLPGEARRVRVRVVGEAATT
ncbi:MAG: hydantoinase/oxoprolinase family protein [Alphaproteobacteria bacterium]|jgi:N-methylhydantoinase A/oxoprolinase/acetone carboxylase beta subunit|nr:hydantoinase/oxoprolinase family protein [Alphaproteobacteria bacterium]